MRVTFSADEQVIWHARSRAIALGTTLNQLLRERVEAMSNEDAQIESDIEFGLRTSGQGNSKGWKWNREDAYEERLRWPRH